MKKQLEATLEEQEECIEELNNIFHYTLNRHSRHILNDNYLNATREACDSLGRAYIRKRDYVVSLLTKK